jgi:hypothetical protein
VATVALGAAFAAASAIWRAIPWTRTHAELHAAKEPLPPHEHVAAVWWSDEGWAIAAGAKGQVLVREAPPSGVDASSWRALPSATRSDLAVIAGGKLHRTAHALIAGDDGAAFRVEPWFAHVPYPLPPEPASQLRANRIADLPVTTDLRAVAFSCSNDEPYAYTCYAVLTGPNGVQVNGVRTGFCDDGQTASGSRHRCDWAWRIGHEASPPLAEAPLRAWSPVAVVSTKLTATHEERERARLSFGPGPLAEIDGLVLPLHVERRFVAAATPYGGLGAAALFVDDAGDVYLAR